MKPSSNLIVSLSIVLFSIMIIIYIKDNQNEKTKNNLYPFITKKDSLNDVVSNIEKTGVGTNIRVDFKSKKKHYVSYTIINSSYDQKSITSYISIGDSIIKNNNNDTIYLIKGRERLFFTLH